MRFTTNFAGVNETLATQKKIVFWRGHRVGDVVDGGRVGQDLPQGVVLHVLGQLHEDGVAVGILDGEQLLKVDTEF